MSTAQDNVAIIGGGIAGMALALLLAAQSLPATIYEARSEAPLPHRAGGGMMLCPNALRILDPLGLYEVLLSKAYSFDYVYYKNGEEATVDRYPLGGAAEFGYDAVRIFRQELVEISAKACRERGVAVEYGKRFARVVEEDEAGVEFEFRDGGGRGRVC